ncbi:DEAD/DEAH box helicase family protein [Polaribacter sp. IC063]|uniref:DEAD/DEAH box helicase family protein n=1 Tax=Polaribacter sp. IC063 TaxID=57031 RepID=UPI0011BE884F|nr:DEAD/DEAH box helicase family protein [Polaribacter sp. IC063]TXD53920.1 DEAD/DEAH box helicase [Polaribacter sp. IC063]
MLKTIDWSKNRDYSTGSENEPVEFYIDALSNSKSFDLLLGYFSSTAINILSLGFASFIYSGGKMRIAINNILSEKDKEAIQKGQYNETSAINFSIKDIQSLRKTLDEYSLHFFECLAWLISTNKIEIKIIEPKGKGISHFKTGIFSDGENKVAFNASCNFTAFGLVENLERLECTLSWDNNLSNSKIDSQVEYFNTIFNEEADFVNYLDISDVMVAVKSEFGDKDIDQLLIKEKELIQKKKDLESNINLKKSLKNAYLKIEHLEELALLPKFPYDEGPRLYQNKAYEKWVENNRKGLFAMATGTGKTITSLNCILEDYKINNFYKFIVLVPTISLANQWEREITKKFNFEEVTICSSQNNGWEESVRNYGRNIRLGNDIDFCILLTYATFRGDRFQNIFNDLFKKEFKNITIIADEAHTLGSTKLLNILPNGIEKRIGLSATPERQYDEVGQQALCNFFDAYPPKYTFDYNMKKAIDEKVLCKYYYYPIVVELETEELNAYKELTKKLNKFLDPNTGRYKDDPYVNMLLIKRKSIIHKARKKSNCLVEIINDIGRDNFKYAFIYVPEGYEANYAEEDIDYDNSDDDNIISDYTELLYKEFKLKLKKFTGKTKNREGILNQFSDGKLDALLAMKCLDEGVDIPQTQYAIFCSSTGNPRQYIQRRGRVLRYHDKKEHADIYDMIVKPVLDVTTTDPNQIKLEKNILMSELRRLVNFAVLAENKLDCLRSLEVLCYSLDIDIYELANIEEEKYNL